MQGAKTDDCYRVIYSNGGTFHTRATTASDYILDPVFIQFIALTIFLYSALMFAFDLPIVAQLILLGAGLMSTFFWLAVTITIHIWVSSLFGSRTIFTPVLLVPLQIMNTFFMVYVLHIFNASYDQNFEFLWEVVLRTSIIILSFDIFHGKFVAPQHGKFVPSPSLNPGVSEQIQPQTPYPAATVLQENVPVQTAPANATSTASKQQAEPHSASPPSSAGVTSQPVSAAKAETVIVGNKTFDLETIWLIRSENHYLLVQQEDQSTMVRGKLRDVCATIDASWGLQINRSVWVAYSAIAEVKNTSNGPLEIILKDDSCLRVAEARRVFFNHSYEHYKPA